MRLRCANSISTFFALTRETSHSYHLACLNTGTASRFSAQASQELTLEVEAEAVGGFSDNDVGVVRDNARQLKFKAESTGFGD